MNNIVPRGRFVEFDLEDYLYENALVEDVEIEDPASVRVPVPGPDMEDA